MDKIWKWTKVALKVVILLAGAKVVNGYVGDKAKNIPIEEIDKL